VTGKGILLSGKIACKLIEALIQVSKAINDRVHTLTFNNEKEFAEQEKNGESLGAEVYFAHPYASWEREINENTNGLIRQYFPKGSELTQVTQKQAQYVMDSLNNRPGKTRGGKTPYELFMGLQVYLLVA
jgi:IS30 family transposase